MLTGSYVELYEHVYEFLFNKRKTVKVITSKYKYTIVRTKAQVHANKYLGMLCVGRHKLYMEPIEGTNHPHF